MPSSLKLLVQSRHPLISIETRDEERAVELVREIAGELKRPLYEWTMTSGLRQLGNKGGWLPVAMLAGKQTLTILTQALTGLANTIGDGTGATPVKKAIDALTCVVELPQSAIYLFKDLGPHTKDAHVQRLLRDGWRRGVLSQQHDGRLHVAARYAEPVWLDTGRGECDCAGKARFKRVTDFSETVLMQL